MLDKFAVLIKHGNGASEKNPLKHLVVCKQTVNEQWIEILAPWTINTKNQDKPRFLNKK